VSLAALLPASLLFAEPGFIDAYYYFHVAANLAGHRGFTEDIIWTYLNDPEAITHPSNLYWMPLVSLVAAPFLAALGVSFRAAQIPLVILSAMVPAATALVTWRWFGGWLKPTAAAALVLFSGYYFVYWTAIDAFGLYALAAGGSFLATSSLLSGPLSPRRSLLLGAAMGISVAVAHLARADGPLLLVTNLGLVLLRQQGGHQPQSIPLSRSFASFRARSVPVMAAAATYLVAMSPWFLRNYLVTGTPLPGGGLQTMFLREYNDIFAYGIDFDLAYYLDQDKTELLAGKGAAALRNLGVLFGLEYWLIPFAVAGWLAALRGGARDLFLPPLAYGVALYLIMTLVFTFPSGRGAMLHSGVALLPWLAMAAVNGVERAIHWAAGRRSHWVPTRAFRNFTGIFVAFAMGVSLYALVDQARNWSRQVDAYRELAPIIFADRPDAVPLLLNAPGWWYATGRPAIQTPSNGPDAALSAAARYGATHLVMEPAVPRAWEPFARAPASNSRFRAIGQAHGGYTIYRIEFDGR